MKKLKKIFRVVTLASLLLIFLTTQKVFANNSANLVEKMEYTEDYKNWLELSDKDKKNVMMPRMYEVPYNKINYKNPLYNAKLLRANINSKFSLKDIIPANLSIRNQQQTNSCWAFARLSSLETNLAVSNYKKGVNLSKVYDFSERHMEYATSRYFLNDVENPIGFNRVVGSSGTRLMADAYLANGYGAIPESEMPFENNENIIDISQIQDKTVSSQLYDTVEFPNYNKETNENKTEIKNQIKQHIQNYGSIYAGLHGNSASTSDFSCYNDKNAAKFCNDENKHPANHAVSIIGWDDNYSIDNFAEDSKPKSNGAWIARNSWGKEYGDNGLIYISYEDVNISKEMSGIIKATDTVNYENLYSYDELGPSEGITIKNSNIMLANTFNRKTQEPEYLTQVSLYAVDQYTCKVYVNPNGTSKAKQDLQLVSLKSGDTEIINSGYHTLEFSKPIEINSNSFTVVIEIQSAKDETPFAMEAKPTILINNPYSNAKIEDEKCFMAIGNNLDNSEWYNLGKLSESGLGILLPNGDTTIKAYTTLELLDESLKNIEIVTPPDKTSYFEGENFDKTGMVVKANYNSKANPSVILDSASYNITNGTNLKAGQTSVKITYEDKTVEQPITVTENKIENIEITTPPAKTQYKEGESFDKTGMVVEATYKDGTTKEVTDYIIENGNNLKASQTEVTISYGDKKVNQAIKVTPNPLVKIEVTKAPNKTKYVVGQNFDKTGMVITGTYQDKSTYEIIDYTIENGTNLTKEQNSVTIKYEEQTITQYITVEEKAITSISIDKKPSKLKYIQNKDDLDLTGGSLKVTYNDESVENIALNSEEISVTGFDNTKLGKQNITVTYKTRTTQFEIAIIEEEKAKNSNLDNVKCNVEKVQVYYYKDDSKKDYALINVSINEITRNLANDKVEYYYYLSSNKDEQNINNWVKVTEDQNSKDKLQFTVDSRKISNYNELEDGDALYLYIKEVAIKGGDQSIAISKSMKVETNDKIETYVDNVKVDNINSGNRGESGSLNKNDDSTLAPGRLPQAGFGSILAIVLIVLIFGIVFYIRYKNLSKYVK